MRFFQWSKDSHTNAQKCQLVNENDAEAVRQLGFSFLSLVANVWTVTVSKSFQSILVWTNWALKKKVRSFPLSHSSSSVHPLSTPPHFLPPPPIGPTLPSAYVQDRLENSMLLLQLTLCQSSLSLTHTHLHIKDTQSSQNRYRMCQQFPTANILLLK